MQHSQFSWLGRLVSSDFHSKQGMLHPMRMAWASLFLAMAQVVFGSDCAALKSVSLENTTIEIAESVPAGHFKPPYGNEIDKVPAFCRIAGVIKPTSDSYIRFEVWLPETGWNQKYLGVGNGGYAGSIDYRSMSGDLNRGFATAATDTGHEGDVEDASWAYKHPEKIVDFGYRALHDTTVNAKAFLKAFYDRGPQHSFFDSCSDGGREALMEAQRFPADFDGILAGAPAYEWTHLTTGGISLAKALIGNPSGFVSGTKLPAINAAVRAACDTSDGLKDGIISDPTRCKFDATVLRCRGVESRSCLTDSQIATLNSMYRGPYSYPSGLAPGSENAWADWVIGQGPGGSYGSVYVENYLRYMVFDDPALNVLSTDPQKALAAAERKTGKALNATNPDLTAFHARGGKLILYHGWYDPAISPYGTIRYFDDVRKKMGDTTTHQFVRLYMVPGMQHCYGGPGPNAFGQLGFPTAKGSKFGVFDALEAWVEQGQEPGEIIATKYSGDNPTGKVLMTRPLCPYPQVAGVKSGADPNEASSFTCEVRK